jgi:hypothetical protein
MAKASRKVVVKKSDKKPPQKARKAAAAKAAPPKSRNVDAQQGDAVRRDVSARDLKYLRDYCVEHGNKAGNITSNMGQEVSAYSKKGLDAEAFRLYLRLYKTGMRDPIRLRALRDALEVYCDIGELDKVTATEMFKDTHGDRDPSGKPTGSKRKPRQADLSERTDAVVTDGSGVAEASGDNVHSLDEHRDGQSAKHGDEAA